jgi:hypothetical protein
VREEYESEVVLSLEYPDRELVTLTVLEIPGLIPETVMVPVSEIVTVALSRELDAIH